MVKKKTEIEAPVNAALQASITPVGIEFGMNKLRLGENYCRIYGIFMLPTEVEYGWLSKLTNIPGTIVTINYEPRNNAEAINDLSRKIRMFRGQAASTKDPKERMRCEKAALSQETALQRMDSGNESMGVWDITIMVLSRDEEDFNNRCTRVENTANVIGCKIRIMANQQKESYQHLSPTYPQIPEIREENARQYLVGDIIGGFPFSSGSFTDSGGFYLGRDSNDGLILLDPWIRNRQRPNSNMTIVGGSGSGKSTAIKHIIASEYARGTKIIVIDPEGEYKDMCLNSLFEGSWIDVAGGRGGLINPLQIRPVPPDVDDNSYPVKRTA